MVERKIDPHPQSEQTIIIKKEEEKTSVDPTAHDNILTNVPILLLLLLTYLPVCCCCLPSVHLFKVLEQVLEVVLLRYKDGWRSKQRR